MKEPLRENNAENLPNEAETLLTQPRKSKKRRIVWIVVAVLLIAGEAAFDIFEIAVGRFLLLTNPLRPQSGRLWEEDLKEQEGLSALEEVIEKSSREEIPREPIRNLEDLQNALNAFGRVSMSKEEFLQFYRTLPANHAKQLADPLLILELDRGGEWRRTQFSASDGQIALHFLDGYDSLLRECHSTLDQRAEETPQFEERLESFAYKGRIVSADLFLRAFNNLDRSLQLQIINDPIKLVQWGDDLQRVGIAPEVDEEGVELAFEIKSGEGVVVQSLHASELAVAYLLQEINSLDKSIDIKPPVKRHEKNR